MIDADGTSYYHQDALGSTATLTDEDGWLLGSVRYDVYGRPQFFDAADQPASSSPAGNRFVFTGREWLAGLDLQDNRNRYYEPSAGRWLSRDPIGHRGGLNLYAYVLNSPINYIDPKGLIADKCCAAKVGAGYLATFKTAQAAGRNPNDSYFHCVTSCEIAKQCSQEAAEQFGNAKESYGGQGDAADTAADQQANGDGRGFAREGRDCHQACQDAYGAPFGNPPPKNNDTSWWEWLLGL